MIGMAQKCILSITGRQIKLHWIYDWFVGPSVIATATCDRWVLRVQSVPFRHHAQKKMINVEIYLTLMSTETKWPMTKSFFSNQIRHKLHDEHSSQLCITRMANRDSLFPKRIFGGNTGCTFCLIFLIVFIFSEMQVLH